MTEKVVNLSSKKEKIEQLVQNPSSHEKVRNGLHMDILRYFAGESSDLFNLVMSCNQS